MQAQTVRADQTQEALTSQQSLQSIQTLLKAGLGCITYLRNLLPAENFSESYLTSSGPGSLSSQPSDTSDSFENNSRKSNVSGFKIMTVTRGFTEEADKLLDYLEHGIFDALQKQYLRSFIFAIYLDNQDPNNIVEAYTFNFKYYTLPGTDTVVPVMSLDADLEKLSLTKTKKVADPVADAMKNGRVPTLGEVKRSLKALIKNLIQATTQMDALPKRRFATFKLFYQDHTPDDYEPKHFRSGDVKKDKWFFTTHDKGEVPERCSVGSLETGYHGVNVRVTSVSAYLPSAEDNNAPFLGTTSGHAHAAPILSPAEEAALRNQQTQIQRQDAIDRRVVWDADDGLGDADADGEDDPDVTSGENASFYLGSWRVHDSGVEFVMPIGIRDDEGNIKPFSKEERQERAVSRAEEAQYTGKQDSVPSHVAQLAQAERHPAEAIMRTQQLDHTQVIETPLSALSRRPSPSPSRSPSPTPKQSKRGTSGRIPSAGPSLPPSDLDAQSFSSLSSLADGIQSIDTQMVKDLIANAAATEIEDTEMLDMETQVVPQASAENDSIQSFSNIAGTQRSPHIRPPRSTADKERSDAEDDSSLDCECGVTNEDNDCCMCEGGCKRWFHIWCMGFHSAQDERIPAVFVCFDCRVRADKNWDLIMVHDLYPRMLARFRDLAIFRRAIKIFEMYNPENLSSFTKLMDCDSVVAGQLFKRLETEGFIAKETIEVDDLGLMETSTRTAKGKQKGKAGAKTRQSQRRKTMQKPKYVFVRATTKGQAYDDYFNPDPEVEKRLLGLSNLKPARRSHKKRVVEDMDVEMYTAVSSANYSLITVACSGTYRSPSHGWWTLISTWPWIRTQMACLQFSQSLRPKQKLSRSMRMARAKVAKSGARRRGRSVKRCPGRAKKSRCPSDQRWTLGTDRLFAPWRIRSIRSARILWSAFIRQLLTVWLAVCSRCSALRFLLFLRYDDCYLALSFVLPEIVHASFCTVHQCMVHVCFVMPV